jgi:ubiquinone/menaquinone biosynthesis C-methylase UbiE
MLRRIFIVELVLCAVGVGPCSGQEDTFQREADRLAALLKWHPGDVLAEVGAGNGTLTIAAARRVAPGKVYATEIDPKALAHLEELAAKERGITAVKATETETNLPPACCDSIFMRLVYHHLTRPSEIDIGLFRSLKPEGRLAVIDEEPREGTSIPEGVPRNRGGHGVPQKILIDELTAAGFQVETVTNDWPSRDKFHQIYCVVFRKAKP